MSVRQTPTPKSARCVRSLSTILHVHNPVRPMRLLPRPALPNVLKESTLVVPVGVEPKELERPNVLKESALTIPVSVEHEELEGPELDLHITEDGEDMQPETAPSVTYVLFSDTMCDPVAYTFCQTVGSMVAAHTLGVYDHSSTIVFGGDESDCAINSDIASWAEWMRLDEVDAISATPIGMASTMNGLRRDGHVYVLGQRDMNKVRLLPWAEVPPAVNGNEDVTFRARWIGTMRSPVGGTANCAVEALNQEVQTYNLIVKLLFGRIEYDNNGAWWSYGDGAIKTDPTRVQLDPDVLNAFALIKLVLLCAITMRTGTRTAYGQCDRKSNLMMGMLAHNEGVTSEQEHALQVFVASIEDCIEFGEDCGDRSGEFDRCETVANEIFGRIVVVLIECMPRWKIEETLRSVIRKPIDLFQNWVSSGSLSQILTDPSVGRLVYVKDQGEKWSLGCTHSGLRVGNSQDETNCTYRYPIGFNVEECRVTWSEPSPSTPSVQAWAVQLNAQYASMVQHFSKCLRDNDEQPFVCNPDIRIEYSQLVAILGWLAMDGTSETNQGPSHVNTFEIPPGKSQSEPSLPTVWFFGAHSHPTADRLSYKESSMDTVVRTCTSNTAHAYAAVIVTDSIPMYVDIVRGIDATYTKHMIDTRRLSETIQSFCALHSPAEWLSLVVGPTVLFPTHTGLAHEAAKSLATKRLLVCHYNRDQPWVYKYLLVSPGDIDDLVHHDEMPGPKTVFYGTFAINYKANLETKPVSDIYGPMVAGNDDIDKMVRETQLDALRNSDLAHSIELNKTHVITVKGQQIAIMQYCVASDDTAFGARLHCIQNGGTYTLTVE